MFCEAEQSQHDMAIENVELICLSFSKLEP